MKKLVFLLIILLILWIAGSAYWFVCRTRCDCRNSPVPNAVSDPREDALAALNASVEEAKSFLGTAGPQKVYFETSRASAEAEIVPARYLNALKLYLDNHGEARITLTGHSDSQGPVDFNLMLSNLRARFVRTYLIMAGISPEQIETSGKGIIEPAGDNLTPEGRAQNRRTEINIKM